MIYKPTAFKKTIAVGLMLTVGSFSSLLTNAALASTTGAKAAGELSVRGNVALNGVTAISGATVFNNGAVRTAENSAATINLGRLGRIELQPGTEMVVSISDNSIGGMLRAGKAIVSAPAGVAISVVTAEGTVASDSSKAATVSVGAGTGKTNVAASRGVAKVSATSKSATVNTGEAVSVGPNADPTPAQGGGAAGGGGGGMSGAMIGVLVVAGIGGTIAGIVAASQSDSVSSNSVVVSGFRP